MFPMAPSEPIDMDFFKLNKVNFSGKVHHVEKVLDKVFPSVLRQNSDLEHLLQAQKFLYDVYLDADASDTEEVHPKGEDSEGASRQKTFGDEVKV